MTYCRILMLLKLHGSCWRLVFSSNRLGIYSYNCHSSPLLKLYLLSLLAFWLWPNSSGRRWYSYSRRIWWQRNARENSCSKVCPGKENSIPRYLSRNAGRCDWVCKICSWSAGCQQHRIWSWYQESMCYIHAWGLHSAFLAYISVWNSCHSFPIYLISVPYKQGSKTHMGGTMRLGSRRTYFQSTDCKSAKLWVVT